MELPKTTFHEEVSDKFFVNETAFEAALIDAGFEQDADLRNTAYYFRRYEPGRPPIAETIAEEHIIAKLESSWIARIVDRSIDLTGVAPRGPRGWLRIAVEKYGVP